MTGSMHASGASPRAAGTCGKIHLGLDASHPGRHDMRRHVRGKAHPTERQVFLVEIGPARWADIRAIESQVDQARPWCRPALCRLTDIARRGSDHADSPAAPATRSSGRIAALRPLRKWTRRAPGSIATTSCSSTISDSAVSVRRKAAKPPWSDSDSPERSGCSGIPRPAPPQHLLQGAWYRRGPTQSVLRFAAWSCGTCACTASGSTRRRSGHSLRPASPRSS